MGTRCDTVSTTKEEKVLILKEKGPKAGKRKSE